MLILGTRLLTPLIIIKKHLLCFASKIPLDQFWELRQETAALHILSKDTIAATGSSTDIRTLAGPATKIIDLAGKTVIPGQNDSHIHFDRGILERKLQSLKLPDSGIINNIQTSSLRRLLN